MVFPRTLCLYSIIRGHQWHCFERINNKYITTFYLFIRKRCLFTVLFLVSKSFNLKNIRLLFYWFYLEYFNGLLEISAHSLYNIPSILLKANRDLKSIIYQLLYADVPNQTNHILLQCVYVETELWYWTLLLTQYKVYGASITYVSRKRAMDKIYHKSFYFLSILVAKYYR